MLSKSKKQSKKTPGAGASIERDEKKQNCISSIVSRASRKRELRVE